MSSTSTHVPRPILSGRSEPVVLAILVGGWMVLLLSVLPRAYWTNDDVVIEADIRGGYLTSFQSPLIGACLSLLYRFVAADVPWYPLYLYAVTFLAITVLLAVLARLGTPVFVRVFLILAGLVASAQLVTTVSMTGASIAAGAAGLIGLAVRLRSGGVSTRTALLLGCMLALCYLSRTSGVGAAVVFAGPAVLLLAWRHVLAHWRGIAWFALPLVVAVGASQLYNTVATTEADVHFQEWNAVRSKFHGFHTAQEAREDESMYAGNDWTLKELQMLNGWFYLDEDKFNAETVGRVLAGSSTARDALRWRNAENDLYREVWKPLRNWFLGLGALALLVWFLERSAVPSVLQGLAAIVVACAMAILLRLPVHVATPAMIVVTFGAVCLGLPPDRMIAWSNGWRERAALVALVLGAVYSGWANTQAELARLPRREWRRSAHYELMNTLEGLDPEFVVVQPTLPIWEIDPLGDSPVWDLPHVPLGWPIYSPRFYDILAGFGMERAKEVFPALVERRNAFLVGSDAVHRRVVIYLRDNHGLRVKTSLVAQNPLGQKVVRLVHD